LGLRRELIFREGAFLTASKRAEVIMPTEHSSGNEVIDFGPFRLLPEKRLLLEQGAPLGLGSRAFDILVVLARRAGETVTKEELLAKVWPGVFVEEGTLRVHIGSLRRALREGLQGRNIIATVPSRGYSLVMPSVRFGSDASAPLSLPAASQLPSSLNRVVGRKDAVAALMAQLPVERFITVVGPGGIGKTTVIVAIANALRGSYRDGIQFVDLAPMKDPSLIPSAVASLLGVSIRTDNPMPTLVAALGTRQMLLVLDCCEHMILAAAALTEAIFVGAPGVHILATSREALRAEGERVHRLPALETPPPAERLTAEQALAFPAVQLFVERASAALDSFRLTDDNAPVVAEICRRLDGIALAIELAAGRVDSFGVNGVAARLDDRFRLLTNGRRTALHRHQTLLATLDWSYQLLHESERVVLRRLSVLAGSFTLEAASAIGAGGAVAISEIADYVANLVSASLVTAEIGEDVAYYRLLDSTRAFARIKLAESGENDWVCRRHAEYFCDFFRRADTELAATPTIQLVTECKRQLDNLRAALDWTFKREGDAALGIALTASGIVLWMNLSLVYECRRRVEAALASIAAGAHIEPRSEMQLHTALGGLLIYTQGPGPEALAALERALEIADLLDDHDYRLRALWGLWTARINNGEHKTSLEIAERIHALALKENDPLDLAVADRGLGYSWHFLGEHRKARSHLEKMLARQIGTQRRSLIIRYQFDQLITGRMRYGWILWLLGYPEQARQTIEAGLDDLWSVDNAVSVCTALGLGTCQVSLAVGDYADAEHYIDAMSELATRYSLSIWRAWARALRGVLLLRQRKTEDGLNLLRDGLGELGDAKFAIWHSSFLGDLAGAMGANGEVAEGLAIINDAIARAERRGNNWHMPDWLRVRGELLLLQRPNDPAAEEQFHLSFDWARRQNALSWELRTAISLANLRCTQGRSDEGRLILAGVYAQLTEGLDTADPRIARKLLDDLS
jgi:predicted ATPase/DNA-binding winged helix-turn-helix (wHTH) protein